MEHLFESPIDVLLPIGIVLAIAGVYLRFFPPKKINWYIGYRTRRARKSQQAWDYAQTASGGRLAVAGVLLAIASLVQRYAGFNMAGAEVFVVIAATLLTIFIPWLITENDLKRKFG